MTKTAMDRAVQKAVQRRFRGRTTMLPRYVMHYPYNLEREYTRLVDAYMTLITDTLNITPPDKPCVNYPA